MNRRSFLKGLALGVIGIKLLLEAPREETVTISPRSAYTAVAMDRDLAQAWSKEIDAVIYEDSRFMPITDPLSIRKYGRTS